MWVTYPAGMCDLRNVEVAGEWVFVSPRLSVKLVPKFGAFEKKLHKRLKRS